MLIVLTVVVMISDCEDVVSGSLEYVDPCDVVTNDSVVSYVLVEDDDASVTLFDSVLKEADDVSMYPFVVIVDSRDRKSTKMNKSFQQKCITDSHCFSTEQRGRHISGKSVGCRIRNSRIVNFASRIAVCSSREGYFR